MKRITKKWLKDNEACVEGYEWYLKQDETSVRVLVERLIKDEHYDWATWTLTRLFTHKQNIAYAIFAAEQVIAVYEKKCADDRPRKAIEAAKEVLKMNTKRNRDAAAYAAHAAADAAYAARAAHAAHAAYAAAYAADAARAAHAAADAAYAAGAAADAAYAAGAAADAADAARAAHAAHAAYAAAYAADAAARAAHAAADAAYAAACAARSKMQKTICLYGLGLLEATV